MYISVCMFLYAKLVHVFKNYNHDYTYLLLIITQFSEFLAGTWKNEENSEFFQVGEPLSSISKQQHLLFNAKTYS